MSTGAGPGARERPGRRYRPEPAMAYRGTPLIKALPPDCGACSRPPAPPARPGSLYIHRAAGTSQPPLPSQRARPPRATRSSDARPGVPLRQDPLKAGSEDRGAVHRGGGPAPGASLGRHRTPSRPGRHGPAPAVFPASAAACPCATPRCRIHPGAAAFRGTALGDSGPDRPGALQSARLSTARVADRATPDADRFAGGRRVQNEWYAREQRRTCDAGLTPDGSAR